MHFARVLCATLPLLSFFATGAIAGKKEKRKTNGVADLATIGVHGQRWPEVDATAEITDVLLKDGRQEFGIFIKSSTNVGKVTITFPATKNSGSLVPVVKGTFMIPTDITEMGDVDEKVIRPCLESVVKNSSKILGSPFQDINHCLKKFHFKFDDNPKEYYLDSVVRIK